MKPSLFACSGLALIGLLAAGCVNAPAELVAGDYVLVELEGRQIVAPPATPVPAPDGSAPAAPSAPTSTPSQNARLADAPPTLLIEPGKSISGSTGCNRFQAQIQEATPTPVTANQPIFGPIAATKRACLETGAMSLEMDYLRALSRTTGLKTQGRNLTLYAADGAQIARFLSMNARAQ